MWYIPVLFLTFFSLTVYLLSQQQPEFKTYQPDKYLVLIKKKKIHNLMRTLYSQFGLDTFSFSKQGVSAIVHKIWGCESSRLLMGVCNLIKCSLMSAHWLIRPVWMSMPAAERLWLLIRWLKADYIFPWRQTQGWESYSQRDLDSQISDGRESK